MFGPMNLRMRMAGAPDFEVGVDASATVADVKIAATAGCDIDPQAMRIIFRGRVLKDDDALGECGVKSGEALHIGRGRPADTGAAALAPSAAPSGVGGGGAVGAGTVKLTIKGPGGVDHELLGLAMEEPVERVRELAAGKCGLRPEQLHLFRKGKMLKDGSTLAQSGVASGDELRVARRQAPAGAAPAPAAPAAAWEPSTGPMPMAWGGGGLELPPGVEEQARMAAQAMGVPLEDVLGGLPLNQVVAAAARAPRHGQPAPGETATQLQLRFTREAQDMARQVGAYLAAERARAARQGPGGFDAPAVGADEDFELDDPEFLQEIAGVLAEARSRGAPVPNAAFFVDRAVTRRRQARAHQARRDREAQGMDPDLEDAFLAAEQTAAASEVAPRRLGYGPDGSGPPPRRGAGGGGQ